MLDILWEDNRILAVNKPSGVATVPGRDETKSVLDHVPLPVRLVHRLDKDTSGVLLLAKDRDAQRHLCDQFLHRRVGKEYLALVNGWPDEEKGEIDAPLVRHPQIPQLMLVAKHGGQTALTRWELIQRFRELTLLRCFPQTGRTHQIRVHLKSIGLPLAIDPLYNRPRSGLDRTILLSSFKRDYKQKPDQDERPLIARLTLHAQRISFHDLNEKSTTVECPLPKDFRATLNMLGKYSAY